MDPKEQMALNQLEALIQATGSRVSQLRCCTI
jgi:hypothetical protein